MWLSLAPASRGSVPRRGSPNRAWKSSCSKPDPGSAAARRQYLDERTGELVDNGQHLLLGCYTETFAFLRRIGAESRVRIQPSLEVSLVDRSGTRTTLRCPPLPAPYNLALGLLEWDALGIRDRLAAMAMVTPLRLAKKESMGANVVAASPGETVQSWLVRNGQTPRLIEMLWEPLALAALNQAVTEASAPPFSLVLARMFGGGPGAASLALPVHPLNVVYAEPAREFLEARRGAVLTRSRATMTIGSNGRAVVEANGERFEAGEIIAAVPWHALPSLFVPPPPALSGLVAAAASTLPSPIVSINLWFDRPVLDVPLLGLPGRSVQWLFDKRQVFERSASHVTVVASGAPGGWASCGYAR